MRLLWAPIVLYGLTTPSVRAETQTVLSLESEATVLATGKFYDVDIRVRDVPELWVADIELRYDPALVYVAGKTSGQPVQPGTLFDPETSFVVRNEVVEEQITFTISLVAPADPIRGNAVLGSFRIYPLAPGTTRILVQNAALTRALFEQQNGRRVGVGSEPVPVAPLSLELTFEGRPVKPPRER